MQKLPIGEAAQALGISKEAIYNRIRRGSLKTFEKDGQKFVILDDEQNLSATVSKPRSQNFEKKAEKGVDESKFVAFLLNELEQVKAQNLSLQADKEKLFKEKEQMLLDAKNEISKIYKERDEKLMAFLNAMQKPLLSRKDEPAIEAIIEEGGEKKWQNLNEFLREQNLDDKAFKKAQKILIKRIGRSKFIKFKDGVILVRKNKTLKEVIE